MSKCKVTGLDTSKDFFSKCLKVHQTFTKYLDNCCSSVLDYTLLWFRYHWASKSWFLCEFEGESLGFNEFKKMDRMSFSPTLECPFFALPCGEKKNSSSRSAEAVQTRPTFRGFRLGDFTK